jgi:hypothetical protein
MSQDPEDRRFVSYMGHFLVSLGCISVSSKLIPPAKEQKFFTSGFVIEVNGDWYLVTCGHVLNKIRTYIDSWPQLTHTFVIYSGMGTFAINRELVRFNYREPDFCVDRNEGLDFGAIKLTPSERATLSSNSVIVVEERYWDQDLPLEFSKFAEMGLPLQNMDLDTPGQAGIQPVFLRVEPTGVEPEYAHHTDKMRYFKIMEPSRLGLDIEGMSGCPVFAFWERPGKDMKALVCAMQSGWLLPKKRVLATVDLRFACQQLRDAVGTKPAGS